jgi:hypothetical protein
MMTSDLGPTSFGKEYRALAADGPPDDAVAAASRDFRQILDKGESSR